MSAKELRYKRCAHVEAGSGERCELDVTHTGQHEGATMAWLDVAVDRDGEPTPPLGDTPAGGKTRPRPAFVQCSHEAWCVNAYRRCEEEAGHSGPHGCTYKGEEWVTF